MMTNIELDALRYLMPGLLVESGRKTVWLTAKVITFVTSSEQKENIRGLNIFEPALIIRHSKGTLGSMREREPSIHVYEH